VAREEIDEGVVGRAEAIEDGVAGRAEDDEGVVGRANAADGVAGRPPEDEGVAGRAEAVEEGVDGRPPDEVLAGGGGAAAEAVGAERRDRNGEILERVDLSDDIAAAWRRLERSRSWGGGLGFWRGGGEHELVGKGRRGSSWAALEGRRRLPPAPRRPGAAFLVFLGLKL